MHVFGFEHRSVCPYEQTDFTRQNTVLNVFDSFKDFFAKFFSTYLQEDFSPIMYDGMFKQNTAVFDLKLLQNLLLFKSFAYGFAFCVKNKFIKFIAKLGLLFENADDV